MVVVVVVVVNIVLFVMLVRLSIFLGLFSKVVVGLRLNFDKW